MSKRSQTELNRKWGYKAFTASDFKPLADLLDAHLDRIPEGPFKGYASLAAATLKTAFLDAEAEVKRHPDAFGTMQQQLITKPPVDHGYIDLIDLYCQALNIDSEFVRETSSSTLDAIADRVRKARAEKYAKVVCITEARERKAAQNFDASLIFLVQSGRYRGQYALAI